jgi:HEAT repeat protein
MNKFWGPTCKDYRRVAERIDNMLKDIHIGSPLERADCCISERYEKQMIIQRVMRNKTLPLDHCYVNLALVKQFSQGRKPQNGEQRNSPSKSFPLSLPERLKVDTPSQDFLYELSALFEPKTSHDGRTQAPRRILIRGRAGIGKTTLCKKIVYDFSKTGMWKSLYARVLWIPLRVLKDLPPAALTYQKLFEWIYFSGAGIHREAFARALSENLYSEASNRRGTLFLLDGLDEVSELPNNVALDFLSQLLNSPNVIITTRPHTVLPVGVTPIDLELETIGFFPDQVQAYLKNVVLGESERKDIQALLVKHRYLQTLVRIPIMLDALCLTWDRNFRDKHIPETMTGVYKAIVGRLWRKDAVQLGKKTEQSIDKVHPSEIEVEKEEELLGCLALSGLCSEIIEFQPHHRDAIYRQFKSLISSHEAHFTFDQWLGRLSFLRMGDLSTNETSRSYHFLHLTFQEYFAAEYFARQWNTGHEIEYLDLKGGGSKAPMSPAAFLQKYKYSARYDIFWRFVAGILVAKQNSKFFETIAEEPLDLLGPTHQRLIIHCLSEVSSPTEPSMRPALLKDLSLWLRFEYDLTGSSYLARESECPDEVLHTALGAGTSGYKKAILAALLRFGRYLSENIITTLVELVRNTEEDSEVRSTAARVLQGQLDLPEAAIKALVELLKDTYEDINIRSMAAEALGNQSVLPKMTVGALVILLKDIDKNIRSIAAEALGGHSDLPNTAINVLVALFHDEDPHVKAEAVKALWHRPILPETAVETLATLLQGHDYRVQYLAVEALGDQLTLPETAIKPLIVLLKDQDLKIQAAAAYVLEGHLTFPEIFIKPIVALFHDENIHIRSTAVKALGRLDLPETAIQAIFTSLIDSDKDIRSTTIRTSRRQPASPETAIEALVVLLQDEDDAIRTTSTEALRDLSALPETAIEALVTLLHDGVSQIRATAAEALGYQPNLPGTAIEALVTLFQDRDSYVRATAAEALGGQSGLPATAVEALVTLFQDKDNHVRASAAKALGYYSALSEPAIGALISLFQDRYSHVRASAVKALGNQSTLSESAIKSMVASFEDEDKYVRVVAVSALRDKPALAEMITEALVTLLHDKESYLRALAAGTLGY